jgi:hypothetical protein
MLCRPWLLIGTDMCVCVCVCVLVMFSFVAMISLNSVTNHKHNRLCVSVHKFNLRIFMINYD